MLINSKDRTYVKTKKLSGRKSDRDCWSLRVIQWEIWLEACYDSKAHRVQKNRSKERLTHLMMLNDFFKEQITHLHRVATKATSIVYMRHCDKCFTSKIDIMPLRPKGVLRVKNKKNTMSGRGNPIVNSKQWTNIYSCSKFGKEFEPADVWICFCTISGPRKLCHFINLIRLRKKIKLIFCWLHACWPFF